MAFVAHQERLRDDRLHLQPSQLSEGFAEGGGEDLLHPHEVVQRLRVVTPKLHPQLGQRDVRLVPKGSVLDFKDRHRFGGRATEAAYRVVVE